MRRRIALIALTLTLGACASVTAPPAPVTLGLTGADRFSAAAPGAPMPLASDLLWWQRFDDPMLGRWVERALANNPGVDIARERVVQARALLRGARAQRRPLVGAATGLESRSGSASGQGTSDASVEVTLDWDLDVGGGLLQAERSAAASVLRTEDLVQAARLSVAALTARAYVEWQEARLDQALLADALAMQAEVQRVVRVLVRTGLAPQIDLDRARADAATIEADSADAAVRVRQAAAALQVLAGERPQAMDGANGLARLPGLRGQQPVPRPIDLLRLRPDLRAAERSLAVAAANLGVAESAFYPRLRLPGTLALTSAGLGGGVLSIVSQSVAAVLDMVLYDGGERSAGVDFARSRVREAGQLYRQTLLQALQQAEAALIAEEGLGRRIAALQRAGTAAEAALSQARTLYSNGLTGFIDVLDAQRIALTNRQNLLSTRADAVRQGITLFEVMGMIAAEEVAR
ncbi:RND efflux system, outer membrane lipoprotein, NodT [Oxalobacteraceae bacterium IMCC9480]|nr:RND efflux system, outer membrane lipoprotein, NodT [Oxalobacteraceae bacterium IMCC9480]NDP58178.1 efflux transporter outer membrane subunit [Oxalobacteraceae bacterium]